MANEDETWFILYDGTSVDGKEGGHYCGRTIDKEVAKQHYKNCLANPHNTGGVVAYTATKVVHIYRDLDWDKL